MFLALRWGNLGGLGTLVGTGRGPATSKCVRGLHEVAQLFSTLVLRDCGSAACPGCRGTTTTTPTIINGMGFNHIWSFEHWIVPHHWQTCVPTGGLLLLRSAREQSAPRFWRFVVSPFRQPRHVVYYSMNKFTMDVNTTHTVGHIPLTCTGFDLQ